MYIIYNFDVDVVFIENIMNPNPMYNYRF